MHRSIFFRYACIAFFLGIACASFFRVRIESDWLLFATVTLLVLISIVIKSIRVAGFIFLIFLLGFFRLSHEREQSAMFSTSRDNPSWHGRVVAEPDVRTNHVKLTVQPLSEGDENGRVLIHAPLYPRFHYGDELLLNCDVEYPKRTGSFDYAAYLAAQGVYGVCFNPVIRFVKNEGNLLGALFAFKESLFMRVSLLLPEPHASFLSGLLLGAKRAIPKDVIEQFHATGVTHIVALSGFNITILAWSVMSMARASGASRTLSFGITVVSIILFVVMTGAQSSAVRAGIMGTLGVIAQHIGRPSDVTNALLASALVMLVAQPQILLLDAGFQLSFLATIGLLFAAPRLRRFFLWLPNTLGLRESLLASVTATLFTSPLIAFRFHRLSLIAPLVNLLIVPLIPTVMAFGVFLLAASFIWMPLGQLVAFFVWLLLEYMLRVIHIFSLFSGGSYEWGSSSHDSI